ncbi:MAG: DNA-binding response regulator [Flavobacterium sp. BFFFF1]|uniref:LytR/AlgR family response regulator transcription factor n=1 Tax=Flavobacterium sp. BFFFF1 TaxID=2015557 RepID=UPI000BCF7CA3|nr:LytTR family DNA-binding domain-containing protein [Flavobacterium sp. BFFFF1]OYU80715.1 MAG: DNA-binding response regulator [Flavobacterium sp. BFFFF1]
MRINTVIIDDEPLAIEVLKKFSETTQGIEIVATFTNPVAAIKYLSENKVDLVFLDIEMPLINGVDLVDALNHKPNLIFTTAFPQYAIEGFNLDAVDYLLKPVSYKRFLKAVNKITKTLPEGDGQQPLNYQKKSASEHRFIFVKSDYENLKVNIHEITYIEGLKDYLKINLCNGKYVLTLSNFSSLIQKIDTPDFIRTHNSFIVNLNYVVSIQKNKVLVGDKRIPISETYKKDFFDKVRLT